MTASFDHLDGLDVLIKKAAAVSGTSGNVRVERLHGDGSDRKFYRIFCGSSSLIGLMSPRLKMDSTDENDSYLLIGNHLHSRGLPAPRILYADAANGRFILEDFGDLHLQEYVRSRRKNLVSIYDHVISMLGSLHLKAADGFSSTYCFDAVQYTPSFVYERELEYFRKSFLNGCLRLDISADELRPEFEALAELAGEVESPFVFHRDFQSRNIMVWRSKLRLIDFQGMRFGPPAYDLASLLIDPYVKLPDAVQDRLLGKYWLCAGCRLGVSKGDFLRKFEAVRLARNFQILGAYGFLGITKGKKNFLNYIPYAFDQLRGNLSIRSADFPRLNRLAAKIGRSGLN